MTIKELTDLIPDEIVKTRYTWCKDEIKAMYYYWKMLYGKEVADEYLEYLKSFKK